MERNAPNLLVKIFTVPLIITRCDHLFFFTAGERKNGNFRPQGTLIRANVPLFLLNAVRVGFGHLSRDAKSDFRSSTFALWAIIRLGFAHIIKKGDDNTSIRFPRFFACQN